MRLLFSVFVLLMLSGCSNIMNVSIPLMASTETVERIVQDHPVRSVAVATEIHKQVPEPPPITEIKVSAAGDVTIGSDESFGYKGTFNHEVDMNGLAFFVEHIRPIFENDDFTTVNLETTLTTSSQKAEKKFRFKGDPSYADILTLGSIEAVNLANNHTYDYLQKGYQDTIDNLKSKNIGFFGNKHIHISTIKDIKVGALGYNGWSDNSTIRNQIQEDIQTLRDQDVKIIIVHFHWGEERAYVPNDTQKSLGRFTIDSGADLVLGHHPHVVQGIEEYNNKFIVYSLGNFMFGGNRNPSDKDTFVFQQTFHLQKGELLNDKQIQVIPFRISSVTSRNNYQPIPLTGNEAARVKNKIIDLSAKITNSNWVVYETSN